MPRLAWWSMMLCLCGVVVACGGSCPAGAGVARRCVDKTLPVGHWSGDWESYPIDNPDSVRSGNIDLVIAQGGKLTGHTTEDDNPDTGTLTGSATAGGEFDATAVVARPGRQAKYTLKGTFACDADGLAGIGSVGWGESGRGNIKFRVHAVE